MDKSTSQTFTPEIDGNPTVLDCPQAQIKCITLLYGARLRQQSKHTLKTGQSAGVDTMTRRHDSRSNLNLQYNLMTREWPTTWTQSIVITLMKKDRLLLYQTYSNVSLNSHLKRSC